MKINLLQWRRIKTFILIIIWLIPGIILSQTRSGKVFSTETDEGIGFVNIGIIGRNTGTVSDQSGNFTIKLDPAYYSDSLRFSMIGYESSTFLVKQFIQDSLQTVYLNPVSYDLPEIEVKYRRPRKLMLGNPVETDALRSGFSNNELGSELGIKANARKRMVLNDINLNVAICSYDSVTYRLNIYVIEDDVICNNILTRPIYISFSKNSIKDAITFDLLKYSIIVEGDILITLELYKDLGEGKLLFRTEYFTGITFHRKTSEGDWTQSPGVIGIYINGIILD